MSGCISPRSDADSFAAKLSALLDGEGAGRKGVAALLDGEGAGRKGVAALLDVKGADRKGVAELSVGGKGVSPGGETEAAVLVPIYLLTDEPHVVLTRRHTGLRRHAGEISFPGGRRDPDDETLKDTALREAEEEIGLPREAVSLAGALTPTTTFVTNYLIHPFVGTVTSRQQWSAAEREVEAVIELPLRKLAGSLTRTELTRRGFTFETNAYVLSGHLIWGATARILEDLLGRLAPLLAGTGA